MIQCRIVMDIVGGGIAHAISLLAALFIFIRPVADRLRSQA